VEKTRIKDTELITTGNLITNLNADMVDNKHASDFAPAVHNHDDRYYTKSESDSRFVNASGDTMTGSLNVDDASITVSRTPPNDAVVIKNKSTNDYFAWRLTSNNTLCLDIYDATNNVHRYPIYFYPTKSLVYFNVPVRGNTNGALYIDTGYGYLQIGPQNTGYCHFITDRSQFYFNKQIVVNGHIVRYHNDQYLRIYGAQGGVAYGAWLDLYSTGYSGSKGEVHIGLAYDSSIPNDPYFRIKVNDIQAGTTSEVLTVDKSGNLWVNGYGDFASLKIGGTEVIDSSRNLKNVSASRSIITDFWATPFWDNIPDKPSEFPPEPHTHAPSDISPQGDGSGLDADTVDGKHASDFASANHTHTFLDLTDTPSSYSGCGGYFVRVKETEDGLEFVEAAGGVGGSGTTNHLAKWTDSTTLGDSIITDDGSTVTINGDLLAGSVQLAGTIYGLTNVDTIIGEAGVVSVGGTPVTVTFQHKYKDPVVVAVPRLPAGTYRSGDVTAQHHIIYDVTSTGFKIVQRESPGGDGTVDTTDVAYLVLESGIYRIGGLLVEVGKVEVGGSYTTVNFKAPFSKPPVVLAATQTDRNGLQVRTRVKSITETSFQVQIEAGDSTTPSLSQKEVVGYIAIEPGVDQATGIEAVLTSREVSDSFKTYTFSLSYSSPPVVIAHLDSEYGGDPAYAVTRDVTTTDFEVAVEETSACDGPHTTEVIGWVAIPEGVIRGSLYVDNALNVNGGLLYVDPRNSRVGINTNEPSTTLDVNGDLTVATDKIRTNYPTDSDITIKASRYFFGAGTQGSYFSANAYFDGSKWVNIDGSNYGAVMFVDRNAPQFRIRRVDTNNTYYDVLKFWVDTGHLWIAGDLQLGGNDIKDSNGNIAIALDPSTSSPNAKVKLHSIHLFRTAGPQIYSDDGTLRLSGSVDGTQVTIDSSGNINVGGIIIAPDDKGAFIKLPSKDYQDFHIENKYGKFRIVRTGVDYAITVDGNNKRIGLWNDNPSYTVHISGDTNVDGVLYSKGEPVAKATFPLLEDYESSYHSYSYNGPNPIGCSSTWTIKKRFFPAGQLAKSTSGLFIYALQGYYTGVGGSIIVKLKTPDGTVYSKTHTLSSTPDTTYYGEISIPSSKLTNGPYYLQLVLCAEYDSVTGGSTAYGRVLGAYLIVR